MPWDTARHHADTTPAREALHPIRSPAMARANLPAHGSGSSLGKSDALADAGSKFPWATDATKAVEPVKSCTALQALDRTSALSVIERGVIRSEVISFEDLVKSGSMANARQQGLVRLEGRQYVLQHGDISHFLFNV